MAATPVLVVVAVLCLASSAFGCVFEYGTTKEAAAIAGAEYNYAYNGLTWMNKFEGCRGQKQSPILLPATGAAAESLEKPAAKSTFSYGTIKDAVIVNNGHGMQVSLPKDFKSDVKIPVLGAAKTATATSVVNGKGDVTYVKATPAQFHFHTTSEHVMSGAVFAMEMHIVHFIQPDQLPACGEVKGFPGCPVVLGIMIALTNDESEVHPELKRLVEAMPLQEGQKNTISGDLDVGSLLPKNMAYMQYEGSLTTPPCSEGLLWHVLTTPIKISQKLLTKYQEAVGDLYCNNDKENDNKRIIPHEKPDANGTYFQLPRSNAEGCYKLANGHNYRAIQPLNGRVIKMAT